MLPDEREYRVGPRGYVTKRDGVTVHYEPGSLVWLRKAPVGADLAPTGRTRKYETKDTWSRSNNPTRLQMPVEGAYRFPRDEP